MSFRLLAVSVALGLFTVPAFADMMAAPPPLERALVAPVVVVGKVAAIEKDTVEASPYPKAPKINYAIAIVKIDDSLTGAKGLTHIKVGFQPGDVNAKRGFDLRLKEGQEACLYLKKHSEADFYVFDYMSQPMFPTAPNFKKEITTAKVALGALADPIKALKAEKAEDRYLAAVGLVTRYRTPIPGSGNEQAAIPVDERTLIYAALLEPDWSKTELDTIQPARVVSRFMTGDKGSFRPSNFTGNGDYNAFMKAEFKKWVNGESANFELRKFVPKRDK